MKTSTRGLVTFCITAAATWFSTVDAAAFQGRLVNRETGRPVAGAEVGVVGFSGTVKSDQDGRFVWSPDPPVPFDLMVILPGGQLMRPVRVAELAPASPLVVSIDPAIVETLVIAGAAPGIDAMAGSAARTLVSSLDVATRAPTTLLQTVETVTGVSGVAEGQSAVPTVRGLARGRTLLLLDGSRLFSERRAGPSVSYVSPDNLDRVEVARGPASVAYGSDAFGGVIALTTRRPAIGEPLGARLTLSQGAGVPTRRVEAEGTIGLGSRAALLIKARQRNTSDYSSPEGDVPNSSWHDSGGLVRASARAGGWWTAAWQGDFARDTGLPRSDSASLRVFVPFERSRRASASFDRANVMGVDQFDVRASYSEYEHRLDQDRAAAPGRPRRIDRSQIDGNDVEVRALARSSVHGWRLTTGADVVDRRDLHATDVGIAFSTAGVVTSTTETASIALAHKRSLGAFVLGDAPLGARFTLSAGARLNRVQNVNVGGYFGDRSVSQNGASGSLALAYRPSSQISLTGQVARGFRDPTLSDRFFRGPVGRGFIVGNPDLIAERSVQFDAAATYDAGRWQLRGFFYRYDVSNLIERYQSGAETFLFRNRDLARIRGVELEASVAATKRMTIDISGQTGRGRARDDNAPLDDIAAARAILQVRHAIGSRLSMSARIIAVARDTAQGPTEVETPGYVDLATFAGWKAKRWMDVRLTAANLLNQRYYSSPSSRGVLAPGANASVIIVIRK